MVGIAAGALFLSSRGSLSPDEKATALSAQVAQDVLIVISGKDNGASNARIQAAKDEFNENSGCRVIAGTVAPGNTAEKAAGFANKLILQARESSPGSQLDKNLGLGYTVIPTNGLIPGVDFVALVTAVDCTPPQATTPGS
jgi:hypothetical protein